MSLATPNTSFHSLNGLGTRYENATNYNLTPSVRHSLEHKGPYRVTTLFEGYHPLKWYHVHVTLWINEPFKIFYLL